MSMKNIRRLRFSYFGGISELGIIKRSCSTHSTLETILYNDKPSIEKMFSSHFVSLPKFESIGDCIANANANSCIAKASRKPPSFALALSDDIYGVSEEITSTLKKEKDGVSLLAKKFGIWSSATAEIENFLIAVKHENGAFTTLKLNTKSPGVGVLLLKDSSSHELSVVGSCLDVDWKSLHNDTLSIHENIRFLKRIIMAEVYVHVDWCSV